MSRAPDRELPPVPLDTDSLPQRTSSVKYTKPAMADNPSTSPRAPAPSRPLPPAPADDDTRPGAVSQSQPQSQSHLGDYHTAYSHGAPGGASYIGASDHAQLGDHVGEYTSGSGGAAGRGAPGPSPVADPQGLRLSSDSASRPGQGQAQFSPSGQPPVSAVGGGFPSGASSGASATSAASQVKSTHSAQQQHQLESPGLANPFHVELVIPFSLAEGPDSEAKPGNATEEDPSKRRWAAARDAELSYNRLITALNSEGLRIASRAPPIDKDDKDKGKPVDEIWVFVGASEGKIRQLVERERIVDEAHGLRTPTETVTSPSTRLRLLYELLTAPPIQHGLGITPGEGLWERVKGIVALHDDEMDNAWVQRWASADWQLGLFKGLNPSDDESLGRDQPVAVRLYFNFLTSYTRSLLPLSAVSVIFWLYSPAGSYPPAYAFVLALYSSIFVAWWRIYERKLAVRWGTRGSESSTAGRLRPQYVRSHNMRTPNDPEENAGRTREAKMVLSVPFILLCGSILGVLLMSIFMLEAFVGQLWTGFGHQVLPFIPTALFVVVVPQVVALFNGFSQRLVKWEDHPTATSAEKSLTAKMFAMNTITAYMGLYLSAYVYLPFGPYIMSRVNSIISPRHHAAPVTGEKTSLAPEAQLAADMANPTDLQAYRSRLNASRLQGQVFAYLVTNQVIGTFLEVGLPFIMRVINDWRAGKPISQALKNKDDKDASTQQDPETRFLKKVKHELDLPEYTLFTDYAEMVTQFGYIVVWSIVWPLAPVFGLANNYAELRSDALKICKHVRRPLGVRVESIGTWLDTLGIIAWVGAWTSATLIYLFRPHKHLVDTHQTTIATTLASYDHTPSLQTITPTVLPVLLIALAASHGYLVLSKVVTAVLERALWRGSAEENAVQVTHHVDSRKVEEALENVSASGSANEKPPSAFWDGGANGEAEIRSAFKTE